MRINISYITLCRTFSVAPHILFREKQLILDTSVAAMHRQTADDGMPAGIALQD